MLLPELLAPARNIISGMSAIQAGADAVYIGPETFGARKAVGNSIQDIEKLCRYAHIFHARVYATVNTVLYDNELEEARKLIFELYHAGVDAVIFQDYAILTMELPPIALFASTQTHNYEADRIKMLEKAGVSRFILAREMDLKQISEIHQQVKAELEFFIHGALCVSFSGRCFFSKALTGRSGNRGECAQPCRSYYNLYDENNHLLAKNKHVLSLKDLNLSHYLWNLYQAGITSFKIEGRLKDEHYVKNTVAWYRKHIDDLFSPKGTFERPSSGITTLNFEPDPEKVFTRGFTPYFIKGRIKDNTSPNTPKSTGKYLGKITTISGNAIQIDEKTNTQAGDGICFFDKNGKLQGSRVEKTNGTNIVLSSSAGLFEGCIIFRNFDYNFAKKLEAPNACERRIPLSLILSINKKMLVLTGVDQDGNRVSAEQPFEGEIAIKKDQFGGLKKQLSKSGATIFDVTEVLIEFQTEYFFRTSYINELRRQCLEKMAEAREASHSRLIRKTGKTTLTPEFYPEKDENITNRLAESVYRILSDKVIPLQTETNLNPEGEIILRTRFCLRFEHGICPGKNAAPLTLKDNQHSYKVEFNCEKCEMAIRLLP
ncbi:MAG: hypothetical protein CVU05_13415 [Bacteroidetes bacterium HGW-Bacteroidetes-21]|jgi:putative protease|nr:MAG: hypothetical protein CVU05_13415 [Bacteroidetes bacterium HGW-Bacteroidetes-21]